MKQSVRRTFDDLRGRTKDLEEKAQGKQPDKPQPKRDKTDIEIEQVAEILIKAGSGSNAKDKFWDNGAIRLISVLLKLLQRAGQQDPANYTLGNLYHLLQNFGTDGTPLDEFVIKWAYRATHMNSAMRLE